MDASPPFSFFSPSFQGVKLTALYGGFCAFILVLSGLPWGREPADSGEGRGLAQFGGRDSLFSLFQIMSVARINALQPVKNVC